MSIVETLSKKGLIQPPRYVLAGMQYETITGSVSYGVANTNSTEEISDIDVYGFCIPFKDMVFPHLKGEIIGFGRQSQRFNQYQQLHITDISNKKEYDISIYNIIKYFQLVMENNPNMIDSLFTPQNCVLYSSQIANLVRENRKLFLHKGSWFKFKGFAYSQLHKIKNKVIRNYLNLCDDLKIEDYNYISLPKLEEEIRFRLINPKNYKDPYFAHVSFEDVQKLQLLLRQCMGKAGKITKRANSIRKYNYDVKFAYHVVRLINEVEQILTEHDLDLQRNREQLKSIRRGEWKLEEIEDYFTRKEAELEKAYTNSTLRNKPDEARIKQLLLNCLEMHFGSLNDCIVKDVSTMNLIQDMEEVINRYRITK